MVRDLADRLSRSIENLSRIAGGQSPPGTDLWSYWDFVYFSGTTLTTVGFGDILPNNTGVRMLVLGEVLVGIFLLGLTVTVLVTRNSPDDLVKI
jgi:hypothetical protein